VCLCVRYRSNPKKSHYSATKKILKYLREIVNLRLCYSSGVSLSLIDYFDSDFAICKLDRKSISGTCHILGSSLNLWHNKKQACVTLSTVEAKYIATGSFCAQILWLKQ